jgi:hypothetical protein
MGRSTEKEMRMHYTQGPWETDGYLVQQAGKGRYAMPVCKVILDHKEGEEAGANAKLITAAPELLAALKAVVGDHCAAHGSPSVTCDVCAALATIAKAEGR